MKEVDFCYDITSPYSYIAFNVLKRYTFSETPIWRNVVINLQPVLLGAIFKLSGNQPPMSHLYKAKNVAADLLRYVSTLNIPLDFPKHFPSNTLFVQRLLTVISDLFPHILFNVTDRIFEAYWVRQIDITDKSELIKILEATSLSEGNIKTVIKLSDDKKYKDLLFEKTNLVINAGVYGLPSFIFKAENVLDKFRGKQKGISQNNEKLEVVFGNDHFELLSLLLGLPWLGYNGSISVKL